MTGNHKHITCVPIHLLRQNREGARVLCYLKSLGKPVVRRSEANWAKDLGMGKQRLSGLLKWLRDNGLVSEKKVHNIETLQTSNRIDKCDRRKALTYSKNLPGLLVSRGVFLFMTSITLNICCINCFLKRKGGCHA